MGIVSGYFQGNQMRGQAAQENPTLFTVANWLLSGLPEMVGESVNSDEPLSFRHWMNSLGTVSLLYGGYKLGQRRAAAALGERLPQPNQPHVAPVDTNDPQWYYADGSPKWPENGGFLGEPSTITLEPGSLIDRYGDTLGRYVSPQGTSYSARSLPRGSINAPCTIYEILQPIEVQSGIAAPWFGEVGGGVQYQFSAIIDSLLEQGMIREVGLS